LETTVGQLPGNDDTAEGPRLHDWALLDTEDKAADPDRTGRHWLLIRRHSRTGELAFYRAQAPTDVPCKP